MGQLCRTPPGVAAIRGWHTESFYGLQPNWLGSARSRRMSRRMSQGHWQLMESWKRNKDVIFQFFDYWLTWSEKTTHQSLTNLRASLWVKAQFFFTAPVSLDTFVEFIPSTAHLKIGCSRCGDRKRGVKNLVLYVLLILKMWDATLPPKQNTHYSPSRKTGIAVLSKASRRRCFASVTSIWQLEESPVGYQSSFNLMMQSPLHGNCQRRIEMLQWKLLWEASNLK